MYRLAFAFNYLGEWYSFGLNPEKVPQRGELAYVIGTIENLVKIIAEQDKIITCLTYVSNEPITELNPIALVREDIKYTIGEEIKCPPLKSQP